MSQADHGTDSSKELTCHSKTPNEKSKNAMMP